MKINNVVQVLRTRPELMKLVYMENICAGIYRGIGGRGGSVRTTCAQRLHLLGPYLALVECLAFIW